MGCNAPEILERGISTGRALSSLGEFVAAQKAFAAGDHDVVVDAARRHQADKLRAPLRLQLGVEIEGPDRAQLIARVADLEAVNRQLVAGRVIRNSGSRHRAATGQRTRIRTHRRAR
jgi:hypothetical protein